MTPEKEDGISGFLPDSDWSSLLNSALRTNWSLTNTGSALTLSYAGSSEGVPEPSTWLLLVMGLGMFVWHRRK